MEKSRPKRLLGLIKKKQPDTKPQKAPLPSTGRGPVGKPSKAAQAATKEVAGKPSGAPASVAAQAPSGVQQSPNMTDKGTPATPQPTKEKAASDSPRSVMPPAKDIASDQPKAPPDAAQPVSALPRQEPASTRTGGDVQRPRPPALAAETQGTNVTTEPPASTRKDGKSNATDGAPSSAPKQPVEDQSQENWLLYQALVDITSDYVFLIRRDGTIDRLGQFGRHSCSDGSVPGDETADAEDAYMAGISGVVGLVASSLIEHGRSYINRARQEKASQDFGFDATIGGRLCHFRSRLMATEKGEVVAVVRDCTGETLLNSSLSETERYRELLDRAVDGVLVVDVHTGKVLVCNEPAASLFAYGTAADLVGADFLEFVCPEDRERISGIIKEQSGDLNSGQTLEFQAVRKGGAEIWVRAGVCSADWNGALARLVSMDDVTELKRTEDALHQSEERLDGFMRSTHDWVWEINTEGAYTYASPKVRDILGYEPEEVLGKTPLDLMAREEAERIVNDFISLLTAQEPFDGLDVVCLHKDGHAVSISKSGVPFFGREGKLLGYRGIDRNISNGTGIRTYGRIGESSSTMIEGMIQVITSIMETRDRYTAMHQQYVARLAVDIATELGLPNEQVQSVRIAGLLHDLGKMCIPAEILNKPSQLSRVESDILRSHPRAGYDILKNIEFPWPVGQMVLQHHERMNGSGYPSGLKGDEILPEARILAVADVVVAMSSHRPYRPAQSLEKALREILENRGTLYDAVVVDACLTLASRKGFSFQEEGLAPAASPIEYGVTSGCAGLAFGV